MKNKFLAIAAASTAVLGSILMSAPAHAQIDPGPDADITVDVTVPEILFLRTITTATVGIAETDLTAATLTASGSGFIGQDTTTGSTLDTTSPFTTGTAIPDSIPTAYAVWSNSPRAAGIDVTVTAGTFTHTATTGPANGTSLTVAVDTAATNVVGALAPGLTTPLTGDIDLLITPTGTTYAGTYQGLVNVQVDAP